MARKDATSRTGTDKASDAAASVESLTYEQAMAEVEAIADRIESGQAGLQESVASYERGMALIRHCRSLLEQAEQRVVELSVDRSEAAAKDEQA